MDLKKLAVMAHQTSLASGWWPANKMERSVPEMLLLLHRNVAKATDAYRNQNSVIEGYDWKAVFAEGLADVAIQILDMCEGRGVDVGHVQYISNFGLRADNRMIVDYLLELHIIINRVLENVYDNGDSWLLVNGDGRLFARSVSAVLMVLFSLCEYQRIDLEEAILAKNEINKKRQFRHGNKVC
jgi:hypothetical protein